MRLSRRYRIGVVLPTNITYARAIAVCRKASTPDVETARHFLETARDDGIEPTLFMYSAAIWTAAAAIDPNSALEFFNEMKDQGVTPNTICYNGVISSLAMHHLYIPVLNLFNEMKESGQEPTVSTYSVSFGNACSRFIFTSCLR